MNPLNCKTIFNLPNILFYFSQDGGLDHEEYTLALHLCNLVKLGKELPDSLPVKLVPVSKRMNTLAM